MKQGKEKCSTYAECHATLVLHDLYCGYAEATCT